MSIMSMFSNAFGGPTQQPPAAPAQTPGAGAPGNIPPNADNSAGANPTVPADQIAATQKLPETPMAEFADLWKPSETNPSDSSAAGFLGNIDPAKVMEAAGKTDFSKVISQDTMQKISAGGPEAMQAMMEAMNRMAQTVYGQAAIASGKIVEQASAKIEERFKSQLPNEIKRHSVSDNLRESNPIFNNPAVAPLISAMEQQFTVKYPAATAREITDMAQRYVSGLGTVFNPTKAPEAAGGGKNTDTDWSKFI